MAACRHDSRLVAQAIEAEDAARRRIAFELHDDVVQELLIASRELRRAEVGDLPAVSAVRSSLDRALVTLRRHVAGMSTHGGDHDNSVAGLLHLALGLAARASVEVRLDLDDAANGRHERVVYAVARELLRNVERHADATLVHVALDRRAMPSY